jgi:transposase
VRAHLPQATVVVDHFHVVQLANQTVSAVRRRVTATLRGRRVRKDDPEYGIRRRLLRNREDLSDATRLWAFYRWRVSHPARQPGRQAGLA